MKICSLEVVIFDSHTSDHGLSPGLAVFFFVVFLFVFIVIFGVEKTCFIIIRALLSAFFYRFAALPTYASIII